MKPQATTSPPRLFTVLPIADGPMERFRYQIVMGGKKKIGVAFDEVLAAHDYCNQANEISDEFYEERK